jgi:hypothetical protein
LITTITLTLPSDLAEILLALPEGVERNNYAVALMRDGLAVREEDERTGEADPAVIEALQESVAQMKAGQLHTLEDMDAAIEEVFDARRPISANEGRDIR